MWTAAGELGMPVFIHTSDPDAFFTPTDRYNERWEELGNHPDWSFYGGDFPSKEELLAARNRVIERHPETTFVEGLAARLGYEVPTFVRTAVEVGRVGTMRPFSDERLAATEGRVQVAFLRATPDPGAVESVMAAAPVDDDLVVVGRELFWLPRAGISTSELRVGDVEEAIGPMTIRTLGTVTRLARKLG